MTIVGIKPSKIEIVGGLGALAGADLLNRITQAIKKYIATQERQPRVIGVITTPFVRQSNLFENAVPEGVRVEYPSDELEAALLDGIYGKNGFKSGNRGIRITNPIEEILNEFKSKGVKVVIPGMTEIPLLMAQLFIPEDLSLVDTNSIYAAYALRESDTIHFKSFKIGVVDGVGPAATGDSLDKIVSNTVREKGQDHVKVLVEQNPKTPDHTENLIGQGTDPTITLYSTLILVQKCIEHTVTRRTI